MIKKTMLFMLSVLSTLAWAGQGTGNGGDVVVCEMNDGTLSYEILDLYEAKFKHRLDIDALDNGSSLQDYVDYQLKKIETWSDIDVFESASLSFMDRVIFTSEELEDISDSYHTFIPRNCEIRQIAINNQVGSIYINEELWNHLDMANKAALVLHELFYEQMVLNNFKNSIMARELNAFLHGNSPKLFTDIQRSLDRYFSVNYENLSYLQRKEIFTTTPFTQTKKNLFFNMIRSSTDGSNLDLLSLILSILKSDDDILFNMIDEYFNNKILWDTRERYFLKKYWGALYKDFLSYLKFNIKNLDLNKQSNKTRFSLKILYAILKSDSTLVKNYSSDVLRLLKEVKNSQLNDHLKSSVITHCYYILALQKENSEFIDYIEEIIESGTFDQDDSWAFFQIVDIDNLKLSPAGYLKLLESCPLRESCYRNNQKIINALLKHYPQSEELLITLRNILKGYFLDLDMHSFFGNLTRYKKQFLIIYPKIKIDLETYILKLLRNCHSGDCDHELTGLSYIYGYVEISANIFDEIDLLARRGNLFSLESILKKIFELEENRTEKFQNLISYLVDTDQYSNDTFLYFFRNYNYLTKFTQSVLSKNLQLSVSAKEIFYYLRPMHNRILNNDTLDVVEWLSKTRTNGIQEAANDILIFNGRQPN